ncbi:hypothetical protein ACFFRR_006055, partial [Megaselia abdita]
GEHSNETQVTLRNLDFEATGNYYCEVSIDNPIFTKASQEEVLHVILPQTQAPVIKFKRKQTFMVGDQLLALCNTTRARPLPFIRFLINGKEVDKQYVRQFPFKQTRKSSSRPTDRNGDHHSPVFRPPQIHRPYPYDPSEDKYDKSLRTSGGSTSSRYQNGHSQHHHNGHHENYYNGPHYHNTFNQDSSIHEVNHRNYDNYDNKYHNYDKRTHRNSYNHNKHRRYVHEGGGSGAIYNENGFYMSSSRNGHHNGNNNNMQQQNNNNYGLNDGSGTVITGYSGSGMEPVEENVTNGQYTVGQLQILLSEEHIDSNGRLELTCLATIPAYIGPGEQYADYKTTLRNVPVERSSVTVRTSSASTTPPPILGMAARGNESFAMSFHVWPVKVMITCLVILKW